VSINGLYVETTEKNDGVPVYKKTDRSIEQDLWLTFNQEKRKWYLKSDASYHDKTSTSSIAYGTFNRGVDLRHPELRVAKWKVAKRGAFGLRFETEPLRLVSLK